MENYRFLPLFYGWEWFLSDKGIYAHTKLLLNDIKKIRNSDKFDIIISKPLTKSICIM